MKSTWPEKSFDVTSSHLSLDAGLTLYDAVCRDTITVSISPSGDCVVLCVERDDGDNYFRASSTMPKYVAKQVALEILRQLEYDVEEKDEV